MQNMKCIPFMYDDYDDINANTYVLVDSFNNCIVIDPSKNYPGIVNFINKNKYSLKGILITHAHFDHIRGIDLLVNAFHCPAYIGFYDEPYLYSSKGNMAIYDDEIVEISSKATPCCEGESINLLEEEIKVIETPYHTDGAVCYYLEKSKMLFSGDSLFRFSVGRSDFPRSSPRKMKNSLKKLMSLPNDIKVYPGHGPFTTIGEEALSNPFVNI